MPTPASLAEVLEATMRTLSSRIHTGLPAKVLSFDPITNTVDVEIQVKRQVFDEDGEPDYEELPQIPKVPVVWPRGGGYVITLPLAAGDFVWLMFSEASIAEWRTTGQVSEPIDSRRHSIGYPVALPGAFPDVEPLSPDVTTDIPNRTTKMVVGEDGGPAQIVLDKATGTIKIGRDATDFVALATLVNTALSSIQTAFNSHVHATAGLGTPSPPVVPLGALSSVAATRAKAK